MVDEPTLPGMPDVPQWTDLPPGVHVTRHATGRLCLFCVADSVHPLPVAWLVGVGATTYRMCTVHLTSYLERP